MMEERKVLLKMLLKLSGVSLFSFIVYVYPRFEHIDPIFWILAYIFAFSSILDVQAYMRIKREREPSSRFHGSIYRTIIWGVIVWAFGVYIMGIIHTSEGVYDPIVISVHIGFLIFSFAGFGWIWMIKKFEPPFQFFARYLSVITVVNLFLLLSIPLRISWRNIILFKLVIMYPHDYFSVLIYLFITVNLLVLYSTKVGRSCLGARISGLLAFTNIILWFYIFGWELYELNILNDGLMILSIFLHLGAILPQSYWALYFGKLPMTAGVGWNKQNKKTEPSLN